MNRRTFITNSALASSIALTGATFAVPSRVLAQTDAGATPSELGLPELSITVTASAIEGIPSELAAGRYLLSVTAADDLDFGGGVEFAQPMGATVEEFMPLLMPTENGSVPAPLWDAIYPGGVFAPSGQTTRGIVDLGPGEWVVYGGGGNPQQPFAITVTGEMPAQLAEPETSATLTMGEYVIDVSEGALVTGKQWVRVDNIGAQPHFIVANFTELDVTEADVAAVLEAEMTGTPAAVALNPETDLRDAFYTGLQSTDTHLWIEVDLGPGTYVLLCFWPDEADGMPHAMHGMYSVVKIDA